MKDGSLECSHEYKFAAVVYKDGDLRMGSDARDRVYSDRLICSKCLHTRDINPRIYSTNFDKPIAGTFPS